MPVSLHGLPTLRCTSSQKKKEENDEQKGMDLSVMALYTLMQEVAKQAEKKATQVAAEGAAMRGAFCRRPRARVAAKANRLTSAADTTLSLYSVLANYAYGSMYKGTRGYNLMVAFQYMGTQSQTLANVGEYALYLGGTLSISDTEGECAEMETYVLRNELFDALYEFRVALYKAIATLDGDGNEYSALAKRSKWGGDLQLKLALDVADGIVASGDRSPLALTMLADNLTLVAEQYGNIIDRIYTERKGIAHDDMVNWLEVRK